jgi:hypothetical protein
MKSYDYENMSEESKFARIAEVKLKEFGEAIETSDLAELGVMNFEQITEEAIEDSRKVKGTKIETFSEEDLQVLHGRAVDRIVSLESANENYKEVAPMIFGEEPQEHPSYLQASNVACNLNSRLNDELVRRSIRKAVKEDHSYKGPLIDPEANDADSQSGNMKDLDSYDGGRPYDFREGGPTYFEEDDERGSE